MRMKLTKRMIDSLPPQARDGLLLWDSELTGFGLRCSARGHKTFVVKYRTPAGRQRWLTLGKYGVLTPVEARVRAREVLAAAAGGDDPAEERDRRRADLTIADLAEQYFKEGCPTKKPSTRRAERGMAERHIVPLLGRRRVRDLRRGDVERFMRDVRTGKTARNMRAGWRARSIVRGGEGAANRTLALLSSIMTFAVNEGCRPDNPVHGVKRYSQRRLDRFLSLTELARLGDALAAADARGENPYAIAAIRLLAVSGARKSEILALEWRAVDWIRAELRLADSKTGAKRVHLGAAALKLLADLPRLEGSPYVLPSARHEGHFVGLQKFWQRLRAEAGLDDVRIHDLRHSYASVAVAGGASLYLTGKLLGHARATTTERYAHLADDPLHAAADRISGTIAAAMDGGAQEGEPATGDVVALARPPRR